MLSRLVLYAVVFTVTIHAASATSFGQRYTEVRRTRGHDEIRRLAADRVHNIRDYFELEPQFRICDKRHYHWYIGYPNCLGERSAGSHLMSTRLQIEWIWKHLPAQQRDFWTPYIREADGELADFLSRTHGKTDEQLFADISASEMTIRKIWEKAAAEFAKRNDLTLVVEQPNSAPAACAGAALVRAKLTLGFRPNGDIARIQWVIAGDVWKHLAAYNEYPRFNDFQNGESVHVTNDSLYCYRFVTRSGRTSDVGWKTVSIDPRTTDPQILLPLVR